MDKNDQKTIGDGVKDQRKVGNFKSIVELWKDWTVMWIKVKNWLNKYKPTNMPALNDRKGYSHRIKKHKFVRLESDIEKLKESRG